MRFDGLLYGGDLSLYYGLGSLWEISPSLIGTLIVSSSSSLHSSVSIPSKRVEFLRWGTTNGIVKI